MDAFGGFEVVQWVPGDPLGDPARQIHRLSTDYNGELSWADLLGAYLQQPGVERMAGLVVGYWSTDILIESNPVEQMVTPLLAAAPQLRDLRVLFINDIASEESEVSWIENTDLGGVLRAFPQLVHVGVRGGNNLRLSDLALPEVRTLVIESGGVTSELVRDVMQADLPNLEHLEVYLGTEEYGATSTIEDVTPILDGTRFPKLRYLGLKNSDHQDQLAQVLVTAPVVARLEVLDLSMGVLTDEGGRALLQSGTLGHLRKLDLNFNWLSDAMVEELQAWADAHGVELDVDEQQDDDDWRYVALGE
ncbi:hypothetical protein Deima_0103 [Deinococcus maricopensis DSM 21211]|uniref:Repeat-companion domain protein n=2 Tax=Deinococcus TaxID=1298 RepID=E8U329_DEIML|nr:hypothetical protein Deima_0103 [Deinococcus maricopensis DSM 21211]